jgi:hypothetical protein
MGTKYILITNQNPLQTELSDLLLKPELDKSNFVIKLTSSIKPEKEGDSLILNDQYAIEILDKSASKTGMNVNHLCITKIEYDYKTQNLTFSIDEGLKVFSQRVNFKRTNPEIRIDIISAIGKISLIPTTTSIATISEL